MRILLVEDMKETSDFLKSGLEAECFAVDVAQDGEKGAALGRVNDYDIIILDYTMPKKDGKRVCLEIREKKKDVPIIMLSIKSEIPTKVEMLDLGVDDYVTKPFSFEELLARIRALLRRPKEIKDDQIKIGNLILDTKRHLAIKNGKEINLTRKEFMLLEILMKRWDEAVSRAMIMEHVWDMNADPFSNTIEAHVRSLRKKIEDPGEKNIIITVPGVGYKIGC